MEGGGGSNVDATSPLLQRAPSSRAAGTSGGMHGCCMGLDAQPGPYNRLWVYHTTHHMYIVGCRRGGSRYGILRLERHDGAYLEAMQHEVAYDLAQVHQILRQLHTVNHAHGGLLFVTKAVGILGSIRFTSCFYLLLLTKKSFVGSVCGSKVYKIDSVALVPLSPAVGVSKQQDSSTEKRYRKLLMGVDLTKNFYFSYTYDLAATLQSNCSRGLHTSDVPTHPSAPHLTPHTGGGVECDMSGVDWSSMFVWNSFLTKALRAAVGTDAWVLPLVHGSWEQRRLSVFGRTVTLTLLARRSRHFAGTRFKKRGLNDQGKVANEVETEQIVDAGVEPHTRQLLLSSLVQVRGSIPLMWSQQPTSLSPKPEIVVQQFDPMFEVTRRHFDDLAQRYATPTLVLNLLKSREKRPRETILRRELGTAIALCNAQLPPARRVVHLPWDLRKHANLPGGNVLSQIAPICSYALNSTGMFVSGVGDSAQTQSGVLRTNCVDCLDRTNVAQFAYGLAAFGRQLHALRLSDTKEVDSDSSIAVVLMGMYERMGDTLALQYGGSEAHNAFFNRRKGAWEAATRGRDLVTSIRRFYNNTITDAEKQDAINLFVGVFVPLEGQPELWELETDHYLHSGSVSASPAPSTTSLSSASVTSGHLAGPGPSRLSQPRRGAGLSTAGTMQRNAVLASDSSSDDDDRAGDGSEGGAAPAFALPLPPATDSTEVLALAQAQAQARVLARAQARAQPQAKARAQAQAGAQVQAQAQAQEQPSVLPADDRSSDEEGGAVGGRGGGSGSSKGSATQRGGSAGEITTASATVEMTTPFGLPDAQLLTVEGKSAAGAAGAAGPAGPAGSAGTGGPVVPAGESAWATPSAATTQQASADAQQAGATPPVPAAAAATTPVEAAAATAAAASTPMVRLTAPLLTQQRQQKVAASSSLAPSPTASSSSAAPAAAPAAAAAAAPAAAAPAAPGGPSSVAPLSRSGSSFATAAAAASSRSRSPYGTRRSSHEQPAQQAQAQAEQQQAQRSAVSVLSDPSGAAPLPWALLSAAAAAAAAAAATEVVRPGALPYLSSDEDESVTMQIAKAEAEHVASGWGDIWSMVFMTTRTGPAVLPALPGAGSGRLVSFDALLSLPPMQLTRVRLFAETKEATMWQAAQQTLSFLWAPRAPGSAGTSAGASAGTSPPHAGSTPQQPHQPHPHPSTPLSAASIGRALALTPPTGAAGGAAATAAAAAASAPSSSVEDIPAHMRGVASAPSLHLGGDPAGRGTPTASTGATLQRTAAHGPEAPAAAAARGRRGPPRRRATLPQLLEAASLEEHGEGGHMGRDAAEPTGAARLFARNSYHAGIGGVSGASSGAFATAVSSGGVGALLPSVAGLCHHGLAPSTLLAMARAEAAHPPHAASSSASVAIGRSRAGSQQAAPRHAVARRRTHAHHAHAPPRASAGGIAAFDSAAEALLYGTAAVGAAAGVSRTASTAPPLPGAAQVPSARQQQQQHPLLLGGAATHGSGGGGRGGGGAALPYPRTSALARVLDPATLTSPTTGTPQKQLRGTWPPPQQQQQRAQADLSLQLAGDLLDGLLGTRPSDLGLPSETMQFWVAIDTPHGSELSQAFVHWGLALAAALSEYEQYLAASTAPLPLAVADELRASYQADPEGFWPLCAS